MSEGTSLDDIESGSIENVADNDVMNAILSDMNAVDPDPMSNYHQAPPLQPPPPPLPPQPQHQPIYQSPPPYEPIHMNIQDNYESVPSFEDHYQPIPEPSRTFTETHTVSTTKKNTWSFLLDVLRDPLFVGILVFLFTLPELHTRLGKYVGWAYKVGGALSWLGLVVQSLLAALLFASYQYLMSHTTVLDFVKSL